MDTEGLKGEEKGGNYVIYYTYMEFKNKRQKAKYVLNDMSLFRRALIFDILNIYTNYNNIYPFEPKCCSYVKNILRI